MPQAAAQFWSCPTGAEWVGAVAGLSLAQHATAAGQREAHEVIELAAQQWSERAAVVGPGGALSFEQLRARVAILAPRIARAAPPGTAVAVVLPNGPAAVAAFLACMVAGRICLILNADHPLERNTAILRTASPALAIVADRSVAAAGIIPSGLAWLTYDEADELAPPAPLNEIAADNPAIVLYTSGSTGQPKGIVLSRRAILTRAAANVARYGISSSDTVLSLNSLASIAGLVVAFAGLIGGARQLVVSTNTAGPTLILGLAQREGATLLWAVPSVVRALLVLEGAREALGSLRLVRLAGEPTLATDLEEWRSILPPECATVITYGQTEITAIAEWRVPPGFICDRAVLPSGSEWVVPSDLRIEGPVLPTGYLLPEHEYAILDEDGRPGRPVTRGEAGELVVRSRHTALGEWENGRCVAGRLRPDPDNPDLRILRTGDLVRLRPDGLLEVVGRKDRQIKIHGQRIEPAEIEAVLRRVPGVADAAIAPRRSGAGIALVAMVVAAELGDTGIRDRVRAATRAGLPSFMHPARILVVDQIPRLPSGKIDGDALLALDDAEDDQRLAPAERGDPEPASAASRQAVARAWIRTLGRKSLNADLPFEEAGGDSLKLLKLVFHIETQLRTTLPLELFGGELRPSEFALALDRVIEGAQRAEPADARRVFLFPGGGGRDEPALARFRVGCEPALRFELVDFGDWPEWVERNLDFDGFAGELAKQIEARAPEGPLLLAGYSLGGQAAFATALVLSRAGRSVALIALLDTEHGPGTMTRRIAQPARSHRNRFAQIRSESRSFGAPRALLIAISRGVRAHPFLLRLAAFLRHFPLPGYAGMYLYGQIRIGVLFELWRKWCAQPDGVRRLDAPVVLFRSEQIGIRLSDLGWGEHCRNLAIVPVSGGHQSMLSPENLRLLAGAFTTAVLNAGSAAGHSPLSLPRYRLGDTLELTSEAPQCPYLGSGWWSPEPLGTWSASRYAELRLRLDPPPQRDLLLTARLMPLVAESHRETSVGLAVNRMSVGQWTLTTMEPTTEQIRIPLQRVSTGEVLLRLTIDGPPSPAAMGWSDDSRELGVLLSELRIEEVSPPLGVN